MQANSEGAYTFPLLCRCALSLPRCVLGSRVRVPTILPSHACLQMSMGCDAHVLPLTLGDIIKWQECRDTFLSRCIAECQVCLETNVACTASTQVCTDGGSSKAACENTEECIAYKDQKTPSGHPCDSQWQLFLRPSHFFGSRHDHDQTDEEPRVLCCRNMEHSCQHSLPYSPSFLVGCYCQLVTDIHPRFTSFGMALHAALVPRPAGSTGLPQTYPCGAGSVKDEADLTVSQPIVLGGVV
jgi:hypothetical protein